MQFCLVAAIKNGLSRPSGGCILIGVETDLRGEPDCMGIFIGSGCNSVAAHEKPFGRIFLSKLSDEATSKSLPLRTEKPFGRFFLSKGLYSTCVR